MKLRLLNIPTGFAIVYLLLSQSLAAEELNFAESIRERIECAAETNELSVDYQPLCAQRDLITYYSDRQFNPAWHHNGTLKPVAYQMLEILAHADDHGLDDNHYHIREINERLSLLKSDLLPAQRLSASVDLDLLLSDAFLTFGTHLSQGQVNPKSLQSKWEIDRRSVDIVTTLRDAIESDRVYETLASLAPQHVGYLALMKALADYRAIKEKGGWPAVEAGPTLRPGETSHRLVHLRKRLAATGELAGDFDNGSPMFDLPLQKAVKAFQQRHGLETDSIVGKATLAALNVSVDERIEQIRANLERWRWLPADLGKRYIIVNIAGFELWFVDNNDVLLKMPVIVGKTYRETPVFTGNMTYLVINPSWYVPRSIAVKDKLPILIRDPRYIERNHMKLYLGWGADRREIDPMSINWRQVDPDHFPFRIVQKPGPKNALGKIKFMFPNKHNVYLHDTSEPSLFNRANRTFSSGCIRVGKPFALANLVLENNSRLEPTTIQKAFDGTEQKTVTLQNPIPVHILYWTAWVDHEGAVHFNQDIYNRDPELIARLKKPLPVENSNPLP